MSLVGKRVRYKYGEYEGVVVFHKGISGLCVCSPAAFFYASELEVLDDEADEPVVVDGRLQEW